MGRPGAARLRADGPSLSTDSAARAGGGAASPVAAAAAALEARWSGAAAGRRHGGWRLTARSHRAASGCRAGWSGGGARSWGRRGGPHRVQTEAARLPAAAAARGGLGPEAAARADPRAAAARRGSRGGRAGARGQAGGRSSSPPCWTASQAAHRPTRGADARRGGAAPGPGPRRPPRAGRTPSSLGRGRGLTEGGLAWEGPSLLLLRAEEGREKKGSHPVGHLLSRRRVQTAREKRGVRGRNSALNGAGCLKPPHSPLEPRPPLHGAPHPHPARGALAQACPPRDPLGLVVGALRNEWDRGGRRLRLP